MNTVASDPHTATAGFNRPTKQETQYLKLAEKMAHLGHWALDLEAKTIYWSDEVYRIHGVKASEYQPELHSAIEFYHPDDRQRVTDIVDKAIRDGKPYQFKQRLIRQDGSLRWVRTKAECQLNSTGKVIGIFGIFQDITDQVNAQEAAEKARATHQTHIESTSDGYWDWYPQQDYEYMSPRFWQMFGYEPDEKPHKPSAWQDMIFAEDLAVALDNFQRHVATKGQHPYEQEVRFRHKNGSTITVLCRGKVIEWDSNGQPIRMIGTHTDITSIKEAEQRLQDAYEFQRLLTNVNTDLVFVSDRSWQLVTANAAFKALDSASQQRLIKQCPFLQPAVSKDETVACLEHCFDDQCQATQSGFPLEESANSEVELIQQDGKKRIWLTKRIGFRNHQGDPLLLGVAREVTGLKRVELDLRRANAELEEFAHRISHDFRSPLVSAVRLLDLVQDSLQQGNVEQSANFVAVAQRSLIKLENLFGDILSLTKANYEDLNSESIDFKSLLDESLETLSNLEHFEDIHFLIDNRLAGPIECNKIALINVLDNLISNAVKYQDLAEPDSKVTISAERENDVLLLSIADNGLGVPAKSQTKLFNMFQRFHPKVSFGSGLGLYSVKKNLDKIGGSIDYVPLNKGSCFKVQFPLGIKVESLVDS